MDLAYDHIAEQTYAPTQGDRATTPTPASSAPNDAASASAIGTGSSTPKAQASTLQTEFQETVKVFSNTAWGARLGGFWGNVRKQGESVYEEARKEAAEMVNEVEALRTKVVGLGFNNINGEAGAGAGAAVATDDNDAEREGEKEVEKEASEIETETEQQHKTDQETETFLDRFKHEAAKRLKEVQKAEDAADEALLRFGTNIRNFLRDAVSVSAPDEDDENAKMQQRPREVLFESRDQLTGKRVIHTSRFDAQLHVIHTTLASFTQDPSTSGGQWEEFSGSFDVEEMTGRIAGDLEKYVELRAAMEKLVPESVEYKDFWARYYFLRHVVEVQEEKRRELLKASKNDTEEVGWDEDSDEEQDRGTAQGPPKVLVAQNTNDSSTTLHQTPPPPQDSSSLKPEGLGRRSHDEKSVADSDASYDLVSGATSRAPGSPKEDVGKSPGKIEESDEEDWE
ncbi:hypothetical protein LTR20_010400 [Exophiala xenobiotica]|nr:hypothetical protein LTR40_007005 [Exophiala xenobiotica]KAK5378908.1 hypothetical protein LTS13_003800 [Exophiala xenobiotica]KAK5395369.1 hypothetical protein LTR79_007083 [Exophiala xenobiotica]KAK5407503.1 hypothetical protein LTR90_010086 [Exophiala xenobiotica]KAK5453891.1 hypothetical protein LTR20_010400 [Exophiala xenobiotica]